MENLKFKNKIGRPTIYYRLDENFLKSEIKKYIEGKQNGVTTYRNLGIGKTSFYRILQEMGVKR